MGMIEYDSADSRECALDEDGIQCRYMADIWQTDDNDSVVFQIFDRFLQSLPGLYQMFEHVGEDHAVEKAFGIMQRPFKVVHVGLDYLFEIFGARWSKAPSKPDRPK